MAALSWIYKQKTWILLLNKLVKIYILWEKKTGDYLGYFGNLLKVRKPDSLMALGLLQKERINRLGFTEFSPEYPAE